MRYLLFIAAAILLLGCTGGEAPTNEQPTIPDVKLPGESCDQSYSFSEIDDGTFGKTSSLVATVTCAGGKSLITKIDGKAVGSTMIESNETTVIDLDVPGIKDGEVNLEVDLDGTTVFQRSWDVAMLGHADTLGTNYDTVSFREWLAVKFNIEEKVDVGQIRTFMRRQNPKTLPNSMIVAEIRENDGNEPGDVIGGQEIDITETTLTANWIKFDFDDKVRLNPGEYWIVVRIDQVEDTTLTSDTVTIHATTIDREKPGNDYTRKMSLDVDPITGKASETSWTDLAYDKTYNIVLSSG